MRHLHYACVEVQRYLKVGFDLLKILKIADSLQFLNEYNTERKEIKWNLIKYSIKTREKVGGNEREMGDRSQRYCDGRIKKQEATTLQEPKHRLQAQASFILLLV